MLVHCYAGQSRSVALVLAYLVACAHSAVTRPRVLWPPEERRVDHAVRQIYPGSLLRPCYMLDGRQLSCCVGGSRRHEDAMRWDVDG